MTDDSDCKQWLLYIQQKATFYSQSYLLEAPFFEDFFSNITIFKVLEEPVQRSGIHNWKRVNNVEFIGWHTCSSNMIQKKVMGTLQGTDYTNWAGYAELASFAEVTFILFCRQIAPAFHY